MMKSILSICKRLHPPFNRRKRRKKWFNLRLEEAENKIYRLPPPGNGNQKQTAITDFFSRIRIEDQIDELENAAQLQTEDTEPQREPNHQTNQPELRILQWNACSMNEEKRKQLEFLTSENKIDVICVSEIGRYRKISNFPNCVKSDIYTQSAIFWRDGLQVENIPHAFNKKHQRIMTQCVSIADQVLKIHPDISPDVKHKARRAYWNDRNIFIDNWVRKAPEHTIIITGDLNTRDRRFGDNHTEQHRYLDEILMQMEIISDRKVPTRENNTLDITLARQSTSNRNITQEVLHKLNSDHNPTQTVISLQAVPYRITHSNYIYTRHITEYTVMDYAKTKTNIGLALGILDRDIITVEKLVKY